MNTLQINYDLKTPGRNYEPVYEYLESYPSIRALYSLWFIRTSKSATTIRDELKRLVDTNDEVLVVDVTRDAWASYKLPKRVADWLHRNMGFLRAA